MLNDLDILVRFYCTLFTAFQRPLSITVVMCAWLEE